MGEITAKGVRWNAHRMDQVPKGGGIFVVFNEATRTSEVHETDELLPDLRKQYWKRNFWFFSWFQTSPPEYRSELRARLEKLSYDELAKFGERSV